MSSTKYLPTLLACALLGGCGTYVPELQENPFDKVSGQQLVESVVYNVTCEVQDAVAAIYNNPDHPLKSTFLDTWGVQIALNLQVEEKSSINPTANWLPPSPPTSVFNLLLGGTVSADATRQDKLNSYYTIADIRKLGPCPAGSRPGGILLMQSDLGLEEWLKDNVTAGETGVIRFATDYTDGPLKTNVISHEIKFDITTSGNVTPGWKLKRWAVNQAANLLSATRDRTNDLTITLGPTVPAPAPKVNANGQPVKDKNGNIVTVVNFIASQPAANAAFASEIGLAVSNAIKSGQLP
jgi:hypothetical protein